MSSSQTLPPPQGPEYVPCGCGHIEPEHRPDAGACLVCACAAYGPAAASSAVAPATDHTALRDRIRRVLCERDGQAALWGTDMLEPDEYGADADAVLSALPASVDRATVLREEAALIRAHCPDHLDSNSAQGSWISCHCDVADDMERRMAAESAPADTGPADGETRHVGGTAEDCPACSAQGLDQISYPWECPGPEQPAAGAQQAEETRP